MNNSNLMAHLEKLTYFIAIAECGSFRKASDQLHLSQPSLTKSIKILEDACGAQLFERRQNGVSLTKNGELLYQTAKTILKATKEFNSLMVENAVNKPLRLVSHEILVRLLFPSLIFEMSKEKFSGLQVYTDSSVAQLLERIENYDADFGITATINKSARLHAMPLWKDQYEFYCTEKYMKTWPAQMEKVISKDTISKLLFIYAPDALANASESLLQNLTRVGLHLPSVHGVRSIESVATLTECNLGIGLLPSRFAQGLVSRKLIRIPLKIKNISELGSLGFSFVCRSQDWKPASIARKVYNCAKTAVCYNHISPINTD